MTMTLQTFDAIRAIAQKQESLIVGNDIELWGSDEQIADILEFESLPWWRKALYRTYCRIQDFFTE